MFVLWAFLVAAAFSGADYFYIKTFQLENYIIKNYFKRLQKFEIAFGRKTPLKFTNRIKRLFFCVFFEKFAVFLLIFGICHIFWVNFLISVLLFALDGFQIVLPMFFMQPVEEHIKKRFIKKAQNKLAKMPAAVVAVTGSFGKTSTKNILAQMLSTQFCVCASPKSFNTPMGICRTVLENLTEKDDFLLLEFGARRVGDIETLAKLFPADYGIITPVGECHLQTFGTPENVENTKYELCRHVKNAMVFNAQSGSSKKLFERYCADNAIESSAFLHWKERFGRCAFPTGEKGMFAYARNVVCARNVETCAYETTFTLVLDGKKLPVKTPLLGKSNVSNIVCAAAMAHVLGVEDKNIVRAVAGLQPVPHRLQLIRGAVSVLDDSYNSNIDGFSEALDVLEKIAGEKEGKKILVSPGMVELGGRQYAANRAAAVRAGGVCDVFVIMNEENKVALTDGVLAANLQKEKPCQIFYANTRERQKQILKEIVCEGDVVLFENDFPDNIK